MINAIEDIFEDTLMVNQINDGASLKPIEVDNRLKAKKEAAKEPVVSTENTATSSDSVSFSDTSKQLEALKATFNDVPEVDEKKVAYFRAQLATGNYQVDSERIAKNMLNNTDVA